MITTSRLLEFSLSLMTRERYKLTTENMLQTKAHSVVIAVPGFTDEIFVCNVDDKEFAQMVEHGLIEEVETNSSKRDWIITAEGRKALEAQS